MPRRAGDRRLDRMGTQAVRRMPRLSSSSRSDSDSQPRWDRVNRPAVPGVSARSRVPHPGHRCPEPKCSTCAKEDAIRMCSSATAVRSGSAMAAPAARKAFGHCRGGTLEELSGRLPHPGGYGDVAVDLQESTHGRLCGEDVQAFAEAGDGSLAGSRVNVHGLQSGHGQGKRSAAEFGDERVAARGTCGTECSG